MPERRDLRLPTLALLGAAVALACLAVAQPYALATVSIVLLGPLHVLLALRYLLGRGLPALTGKVGIGVLAAVLGMVLIRAIAIAVPAHGHHLELFGGTAIVAFAVWVGLRGAARYIGLAILAVLAVVSATEMPWYWHLLTHGHNIVPLIFLWDWARPARRSARAWFVGLNLTWVLVIPAFIISGALDGVISDHVPSLVTRIVGDASQLASAVSPPGANSTIALRALVAFTFMQAMHYVVWMGFLQLGGRREISRLELAIPAIRGWRFWGIAAAATAAVWGVYLIGYAEGRSIYGILGALNVYLEQPLAVWLLMTVLPASVTTATIAALRKA